MTAELFDEVADAYDAVDVDFFGPIADGLVDLLALQPGERLLDVGSGKGQVLSRALAITGADEQSIGIDLSAGMLGEARRRLDSAGFDRARLHVMDGQAPSIPTHSFDVVASSLVLFFMPDPLAALEAWNRLLVPGGRVGITTFAPQDPRWRDVDAIFDAFIPQEMRDARSSGERGPFASDESVGALFAEAGFGGIESAHLSLDIIFNDPAHWRQWTMSHGQRMMWDSVPAELHDELFARAQDRLADCVGPDGLIHLAQNIRVTTGHKQ